MRNERLDEKDIPYLIGTEVLQALEHVQLAYQGYLHAIDRLHKGVGKKGLQRPGAQARLRVLTQYADLLNVKLELALEPLQAADRLQYVLDRRKINIRTEALREVIHRLQSESPLPIGAYGSSERQSLRKKQVVNRAMAESSPPPASDSDVHRLSETHPIRITIGSNEMVQISGAELRSDHSAHAESVRLTKSLPRTLNRPVIRLTVPEYTSASAQNRQGTGTTANSADGRASTFTQTERQPVIQWSVPDLRNHGVPSSLTSTGANMRIADESANHPKSNDNGKDSVGNSVLGFSDNLMPRVPSDLRQAVSQVRQVRSKPLLLNNLTNIGRS